MDPKWWLLIHLSGVLGLLGSHGASMAVLFKLRRERDRTRIEHLLQLSGSTVIPLYVSLALLLTGGIVGGIDGHFFWQRWITLSLIVLAITMIVMYAIAMPYYKRIREALGVRPSGVPRVSDEELEALLGSAKSTVVAVVGFGGFLIILYLMIWKPGIV